MSDAIELLAAMSSVKESATDAHGQGWESRLAPSAGGTHAIEPLLLLENDWYVRKGDRIFRADVPSDVARGLRRDVTAASGTPSSAAVIFAIAQPELLFQRYPRGASLLWRDAGGFLVSVQVASLALGLRSRILGIARPLPGIRRADCVGAVLVGSS